MEIIRSRRWSWAVGALVLFGAPGFSQSHRAAAPAGADVARIGAGGAIAEADLADLTVVENCYGADALSSRKAGFMRLLEASIMEEVLRREAGVELTAQDYDRELKRVDEGTRAPDILACIKKHFGWDPASGWPSPRERRRYERVFLRKNMLPGPFHHFTSFNRKVQREAYEKRDALLAKAGQGAAFAQLAKDFSVEYSSRSYTLSEPKESAAGRPPQERWSPFEAQFIEENLKALKPRQMKPEPVDAADILFVKLLEVSGDAYRFETLRVAKKSIPAYLEELPKLRCRVADEELKAWLKSISGNPMLGACAVE